MISRQNMFCIVHQSNKLSGHLVDQQCNDGKQVLNLTFLLDSVGIWDLKFGCQHSVLASKLCLGDLMMQAKTGWRQLESRSEGRQQHFKVP
jgi:hypothetical protein